MSIKIKDNVDLKELEKFGFKPQIYDGREYGDIIKKGMLLGYAKLEKEFELTGMFENIVTKFECCYEVNAFSREIIFEWENKVGNDGWCQSNTIFDLIQAGLVEKVEK